MFDKTYEEAVVALVDRRCADLVQLRQTLENGQIGVRQMTNAQLQKEWDLYFSHGLRLTDPQSNPNESAPRRLKEIQERLDELGFAIEYEANAVSRDWPTLKWSTGNPVGPDEAFVPQEARDLAAEWLTIVVDKGQPPGSDHPIHATEFRRGMLMGEDLARRENAIQALMSIRPFLEKQHAETPGEQWTMAFEMVSECLDEVAESVHRIEAWQKAGASSEELAAIARAGGYAAILDDTEAHSRFQDILDRCVRSRLPQMREAFCETGWSGTPSPLALNACGPVYEQLRTEVAGRTLLLAHRMTPSRAASDKFVALTFEILEIGDNDDPDSAYSLVLSMRDELTAPASRTVGEVHDRLEAALRSQGIEVDARPGTTPDDFVPT